MTESTDDPERVSLLSKEECDKNEENNSKDIELTDFEAVQDVIQQSKWLIINSLIRPVHNLALIGMIGSLNDENMLAGFGLGQTFMSIVFLSTGIKFISDGACSLISHSYGQKDYRMCQVYRN